MIETERLRIFPLSDQEMRDVIENETNDVLKAAYSEMLDGCLEHPEHRIWHALWVLQLKDGSGRRVGTLSFKGWNDNGMVEIGYGMETGYEGRGLMTEAVAATVRWASKHPGGDLHRSGNGTGQPRFPTGIGKGGVCSERSHGVRGAEVCLEETGSLMEFAERRDVEEVGIRVWSTFPRIW